MVAELRSVSGGREMDSVIKTLIHHATLAPSGHNTQPWMFSVDRDTVRIHPDRSRRLPIVDPDDHALYISLGCALENLVIAAAHHGLTAAVDYFPVDEGDDCLRVRLTPNGMSGDEALFRAIAVRQSNRRVYDGKRIPDDAVAKLLAANLHGSVSVLAFPTNQPEVEPIIDFVKEGNVAQFRNAAFVNELISWIRFSKQEGRHRQDGLTAAALGFPSIPRWLGTLIMTRFVKPGGEARKQERAIRSSPLLLLFIARRNDKRHWVDIGRSFERVALTAASLGIAHAHVNMPCEVEPIRRKLARHLELPTAEQPLLLIRLGYAERLPAAPRRSVEEVMTVIERTYSSGESSLCSRRNAAIASSTWRWRPTQT